MTADIVPFDDDFTYVLVTIRLVTHDDEELKVWQPVPRTLAVSVNDQNSCEDSVRRVAFSAFKVERGYPLDRAQFEVATRWVDGGPKALSSQPDHMVR